MFHELEGEEERVPLAASPDQDQATNLATSHQSNQPETA